MSLEYEEAFAKVTGPGQLFEVVDADDRRPRLPGLRQRTDDARRSSSPGPGASASTFLVYEDERWSFDETMRHVDALAHALVHRFGITKGDRVGIAMRNLPEWIISFAAILSIGAVSVSFNAWWTETELDYAVGDSGVSLLIADPARTERLHRAAQARGVADHRGRARPDRASPAGVQHFDEVIALGDPMPEVEVGPDDDATILYTSGTTGFPKGAVSTHRAVTQSLMAFWAGTTIQTARKGNDAAEPAAGSPRASS